MQIIIARNQKEFFDAVRIRAIVFHDEQKVSAAIEIDELDATCLHVVCYNDEGTPVGVARLLDYEDHYQVGRVAVLKEYRSKGYGRALMEGIEVLPEVKAKGKLCLDAQMTAIGFYEALNYTIDSEPFLEADIWHRHATKCI